MSRTLPATLVGRSLRCTLAQMQREEQFALIRCIRCTAEAAKNPRLARTHTCFKCKRDVPLSRYSPVILHRLLLDEKRGHKDNQKGWSCEECQYPRCVKCNARPPVPASHTSYHNGKYYCISCRYPPCDTPGCSNPRKQYAQYNVFNTPKSTCQEWKAGAKDKKNEKQNTPH